MRTSFPILQPVLIDDMIYLPSPGSIRAQSRKTFCPAVEEYRCVQWSELIGDSRGDGGELSFMKR